MTKYALLLLLAAPLFAQNIRYDNIAIGSKGPVPFAAVAVCAQPAVTTSQPCTPLANLCASLTDTQCTQLNPTVADAFGNFHFYVQSSQAPVTVQIYGPQVAAAYVMADQTGSASGGVPTPPGANYSLFSLGSGPSWAPFCHSVPSSGTFMYWDFTGTDPNNLNAPNPGWACAGNGPYWILNPTVALGNLVSPATGAAIYNANYSANPSVNPVSISIGGTPKYFLVPFNNSFQVWADSFVSTNASGTNQNACGTVPVGSALAGFMLWGCKSATKRLFSLSDTGVETDYIGAPVALSQLATQAADTVVQNATGGSAAPTAVAMPTSGTNGCAGTTNALTYNTTTHAWGCNTITSAGITSAWVGFNMLSAQTPTSVAPYFLPPSGAINTLVTTEASEQQPATLGGTVIGISCRVSAAEGAAATLAFTVQKCTPVSGVCTGSAQTVTCTIPNSGLTCSDTAHSFSYLANDFLDIKMVQTGTGTSQFISCTMQYTVP